METFEPKYINYKKRTWDGIGFLIVILLFITIIGLVTEKFDLASAFRAVGLIFMILVPVLLYKIFKRNKFFLKQVIIDRQKIHITYCKKDEIIIDESFSIADVRIKIVDDFGGSRRVPRKFIFYVDILTDGKFVSIVKQYEESGWDKELFKKVYAAYCNAKNIPCDFGFMKGLFT